ncbi:MAG: phosphotriesterase, partial [Cyclobacteriaceae bacterium]|nr:phosphotriesterase [Cyclobacteriaceae bacterium]
IDEFESGIDGTGIKPGFIKISVNASDPLSEVDSKIVRAAALTHLQTGLTIGSHTGKAEGLYPQLAILKEVGVSPEAFIWIHAQNEDDPSHYLKAAELGCWISLDGLGWEMEKHVEKLVFAKENGILDHILISHDAGWYDPAKSEQAIVGYTAIFTELIPTLKKKGFSEDDIRMLLAENPVRAFGVEEKGSR